MTFRSGRYALSEIIFTSVCLLLIFLFRSFSVGYITLAASIIFYFASPLLTGTPLRIKRGPELFHACILVFSVYIVLQILLRFVFDDFFRSRTLSLPQLMLYKQLPVTMSFLFIFVFGVGLTDFNWRLNRKTLLLTVLLFVPFYLIVSHAQNFSKLNLRYYLTSFTVSLYCPAFIEEFIYRGLMLGGLIAIGVREDRAVVIQAAVFGLTHMLNHPYPNLFLILGLSYEMFMGILFGKLYTKTGSLTPCILLHGLVDML